jgi:hypothetical protein
MTSIETLKAASKRSQEIIAEFAAKSTGAPDVVEARTVELKELNKNQLIELVLSLEKPKVDKAFKVEDVARAILEDSACAIFTYEQVAALVHQVLPDGKTSSNSIASYASKHKADWTIVPREKLNLTTDDLMAMAQ